MGAGMYSEWQSKRSPEQLVLEMHRVAKIGFSLLNPHPLWGLN